MSGLGRQTSRIAVGFVISIPIVIAITGGLEDALALLFISVVCTAGIALLAWVPAWWLLGAIFFGFLQLIGVVKASPSETQVPSRHPGSNRPIPAALTEYMRNATAAGMDWDEITKRLQKNGWKAEDIQAGRERLATYWANPVES